VTRALELLCDRGEATELPQRRPTARGQQERLFLAK
jgi:hypothetical protein